MPNIHLECNRFIAEQIVRLIRENMNKVERQRLGMLLARERDLLPKWRVVQRASLRRPRGIGLRGDGFRLFNFLHPPESKHRENDVIRHLWPADAVLHPNINLATTLRTRLRKLEQRTNERLELFNPGYTLCRVGRKRLLYLHQPVGE